MVAAILVSRQIQPGQKDADGVAADVAANGLQRGGHHMSRLKQLIREFHRRSLWQVLGVYVVSSWAVLQVAEVLTNTAGLPPWFPSFALGLLIIGLPIVLATAFIQEGVGHREAADRPPPAGEATPTGVATEPVSVVPMVTAHKRLFTWRNALAGGAAAMLLLFGVAGLYVLLQDRGGSLAPTEAIAGDAAPAVAVLPFSVRGAGLEGLADGMVTLLATGLDGAAGLRTVPDRTIMARWRQQVREGEEADLGTVLDVAEAAGARYALIGSAVAIGDRGRLTIDVYELPARAKLDQAVVEGSPKDVLQLADRLAVAVLVILVGETGSEPPSVDLASLVTSSVPALDAFLEGEALFRQSEFGAARRAFERAVEHDSTFALAYYRLATAMSWTDWDDEDFGSVAGQAVGLADRLPPQERQLITALDAFLHERPEAIPLGERMVRDHPDDAEAWDLVGEIYFHLGGAGLVDPASGQSAFARAVELDPGLTRSYIHLLDAHFRFEPDSTRIAELIDTFESQHGGARKLREYRLGHAIAFGSPATRDEAYAVLDTASILHGYFANEMLGHAAFLPQQAEVARIGSRATTQPGFSTFLMMRTALYRGRLSDLVVALDEGQVPARVKAEFVSYADVTGFPVPPEVLASALVEFEPDSLDISTVLRQTVYAIDRGTRGADSVAEARLRRVAAAHRAAGDTTSARVADQTITALRGYAAWKRGEFLLGRKQLEEAQQSPALFGRDNSVLRWWLAELALEEGRLEDAARYFRSLGHGAPFTSDPMAVYRHGQVLEELGEIEEARDAYAYFVLAWKDADPELQPMVDEARARLGRLGAGVGAS